MGSSITVNQDTFATDVLQKSHETPVLIDFFATWCGPCKMLKPILEKLAQEYEFVLAKVDIDANPELASTYGVEGVPDVKVAMDGEVFSGFVGVQSEPKIRELLAQLRIKSQLNEALAAIFDQAAQGQVEQAQAQLETLLQQHPDHRQLLLEAAHFYLQADNLERAEALLAPIQEYEKEAFAAAKSLKAAIAFKRWALEPLGSHELDPVFQQAAILAGAENYEAALAQCLEIVSRDRRYREDGGRKAMLAIFDLLGDDHPLTKDYRKQLMMALY